MALSCVCCLCAWRTTDEIIKKAIDARGGIDKIKTVQSERITGRLLTQGVEGTLVLELERPHKMYSEIMVEGKKVLRVYDGKSAGWALNPFLENKDAQEMPADELKDMPEESDADGPLADYKAEGSRVDLMGKEDSDGKPLYRLKITGKNGDARSYLIDASTFLTAKWEGPRKIGDQLQPWECTLSDYRDVQGLKFPFKIDQGSPCTEYRQTLTVEEVEINPKLDESHFARSVAAASPQGTSGNA